MHLEDSFGSWYLQPGHKWNHRMSTIGNLMPSAAGKQNTS